MKVGDLVKYYDQLYSGLGLVISMAPEQPHGEALVQYNDVTDWCAIEYLEIVNESR